MQVLQPIHTLQQNSQIDALLVGLGKADDAAVYRLNDEQAIISTTDFFTPVVDDPYQYGAIAAANSMSDVYAMGGEVLFALNVAAFPPNLPPEFLAEIIRGGTEKVLEAGGVIAGGHTIQDKEPKFGLAVTGLVHPQKIFTKGGARPGDALVLSKPLGTGTISTALKQGKARAEHSAPMIASMMALNRLAAKAAQEVSGIKAVTDITGFGLLGHALEMAEAGSVRFHFQFGQIPLLDGAMEYAEQFIFPGGSSSNKLFYQERVTFAPTLTDAQQMLLWDAQTSGGLLLAIPRDQLDSYLQTCEQYEQPVWVVGAVEAGSGITVSP